MTGYLRSNVGPIVKSDGSGNPIEAGDTLKLVLRSRDGAYEEESVTVTSVRDNAREVGWDMQAETFRYELDDVVAIHHDHNPVCASS